MTLRRNRWKTWLRHALIAAALVQVFRGRLVGLELLQDAEALRLAGGFYTLREIEQHFVGRPSRWRTNTKGDWIGAAGDVASAWLGAGLSWWLLP